MMQTVSLLIYIKVKVAMKLKD